MGFNLKSGDLYTLEYKLQWDNGTAIDLSSANSVYFIATLDGSDTPTINRECNIVDASDGYVQFVFRDDDTSTSGMYRCRFVVYDAVLNSEEGYRPLTLPSRGVLWMHIEE